MSGGDEVCVMFVRQLSAQKQQTPLTTHNFALIVCEWVCVCVCVCVGGMYMCVCDAPNS